MTGLGEELPTPATEADALVEKAAKALADGNDAHSPWEMLSEHAKRHYGAKARAALTSLGLPLPDLQWAAENAAVARALRSGELRAVRVTPVTLPSGREGRIPNVGDVFAAPKSPSEEV
jgi:hypothetical protein